MITKARIVSEYTLPWDYQAEPADRGTPGFTMRASCLSEILRNARRWKNGYVSPDSDAKEWGEVYDCLLLTPKQWPQRFCCTPATYTNKKGELSAWRNDKRVPEVAEWLDAHKDLTVVKPELSATVHAAINYLRCDEMLDELVTTSKTQVWIAGEWEDPPSGLKVPLKALVDLVPSSEHPLLSNALMDAKTTRNAAPHSFARDAYKYGYHRAAALYLDLWNAATGEIRSDFGHIVQESFPPYEFRSPPPLLSQRFINLGRIEYQLALGIYCRAVTTGFWPAYDKTKEWPITDCEDWCLSVDRVFPPMEEDEEEPEHQPEEADIIP